MPKSGWMCCNYGCNSTSLKNDNDPTRELPNLKRLCALQVVLFFQIKIHAIETNSPTKTFCNRIGPYGNCYVLVLFDNCKHECRN